MTRYWLLVAAFAMSFQHLGAEEIAPAGEEPGLTEEDFSGSLQLPALVDHAMKNNPEIKAARARWQAAKARPSQEGSYPDPRLALETQNINSDFQTAREPMAMAGFSASQEIPFPGKLSLKEEIATWGAEQERERLRETTLGVIARLKVAYFDLYFIDKSLEIVEKDKDILEKFEKVVEVKYQTGQGIQQDVLKAQVEISRLLDRLIDLRQRRESLQAVINSLLYRPPWVPLGKPETKPKTPLPQTLDELNALTEEKSPTLNAADFLIARNQAALVLAKREYFPDFVVKAGWSTRQAFKDLWQAGVDVKIPVYFWRKQRFGVLEAAESLSEARQSRENIKQRLLAQVKDFYVTARRAEDLITLYETGIIPQATLSLESAGAGYQVGKVDFLTFLDNFITLLDFELRREEELTRFHKAVAQLEEVVGIELEK